MAELEKDIQARILRYLKLKNIFAFKVITANVRGIPDICLIYKKQVIFLEVKAESGRITPSQSKIIKELRDSRINVFVVNSLSEVIGILDSL